MIVNNYVSISTANEPTPTSGRGLFSGGSGSKLVKIISTKFQYNERGLWLANNDFRIIIENSEFKETCGREIGVISTTNGTIDSSAFLHYTGLWLYRTLNTTISNSTFVNSPIKLDRSNNNVLENNILSNKFILQYYQRQ